ncbi:hypothetical protein FEP63_05639 [Burkholderia multivorans]|nr:hypothetical protein [Burkholderia multivorans]MDR8883531.1 hypothetical protein [Burkholderia multivorans]MDR8889947.1 hypothetical protein [Burkholderia multivorans]MDR8896282.1 hypothetical protein [Burkholderia multivorans]MDR8902013.1 hypothetical protein [Burkholderia multivorans]
MPANGEPANFVNRPAGFAMEQTTRMPAGFTRLRRSFALLLHRFSSLRHLFSDWLARVFLGSDGVECSIKNLLAICLLQQVVPWINPLQLLYRGIFQRL